VRDETGATGGTAVARDFAKKMPGFRYDPAIGSFKGWLLQIARRRIVDQFRKRTSRSLDDGSAAHPSSERVVGTRSIASSLAPSGDGVESVPTRPAEGLPEPAGCEFEAIWDQEWEKSVLAAAIERVKRQVSPEQYQLYDLYVLQRWPVTKVAKELGVSLGRVYVAKHRVGRTLKKELARLAAPGGLAA
jgi:RNA polymerase sigma-70 factor (ECF subfamily)